jgi:4-hydroxy-3-methylbut-2-enyl diphosphate reductase
MQLQKQCQAGAPSRRGTCRQLAQVAAPSRISTVVARAEAETAPAERDSGRIVRRSLNKTGRYTRQPTNDKTSDVLMETHGVGYSSRGLVAQMRDNGNAWQQGDVTVRLAASYGYCWGVERAVRMAYEARQAFPSAKVHMTNEIIHNPQVNQVRHGWTHACKHARCGAFRAGEFRA